MAGLRISLGMVGVKEETGEYTFEAPVASDAFFAHDISYTPDGGSDVERNEMNIHFGKLPELRTAAMANIAFSVRVAVQTIGVPPTWMIALRACGYETDGTITTGPIDVKPTIIETGGVETPDVSYTIAIWEDGIKYAIKGAKGNAIWNFAINEAVIVNFDFRGAYVAPIDQAVVTPGTLLTNIPIVFTGATWVAHGDNHRIENLTVDTGNVLADIGDASDGVGILGVRIVDRRSVGSFDPLAELVTDEDVLTDWRGGAQLAIGTAVFGNGVGNQMQFDAAKTQIKAPSQGDRGGLRSWDVPFSIVSAQGDIDSSDMEFKFT